MRRVAALCGEARIQVFGAVGVNLVLAVGLVVVLALTAFKARVDLGTNTDTITLLSQRHFGADAKDLANDFVADGQRVRATAPFAADGVQVTGADTTALNLDINIVVAKRTRLPRALLEVEVVLGVGCLETLKVVGDAHDCVVSRCGMGCLAVQGNDYGRNPVRC